MIADPDMVHAVYPDRAMAAALSYQDCRYREVYSVGGGRLADIRASDCRLNCSTSVNR